MTGSPFLSLPAAVPAEGVELLTGKELSGFRQASCVYWSAVRLGS